MAVKLTEQFLRGGAQLALKAYHLLCEPVGVLIGSIGLSS